MKDNQLKNGVLLSYLNFAIKLLVHFLYTPIMIRLLGQSDYGLYTLVGSVVSYLSLFGFGFSGAYLRFYSRYKAVGDDDGEASLNGLFLIVYFIMAFIAIICGLVLSRFPKEVFGTKLTDYELVKSQVLMVILVFNIGLSFPTSVFSSIVCAHERFAFQRMLDLASTIFNPLICLPLLIAGFGSVALVTVTTGISIISLIVYVYYCIKFLNIKFDFAHFNVQLLKEIFVFSAFLFLNIIIDQINWHIDKFILGRTSGTIEVALYGVGAQFNSFFLSLTVVISSVFAPRVNMIEAQNSHNKNVELSEMFVRTGRIQYVVILYVFSIFVMVGKPFIIWWIGEEYSKSYFVVLLLVSPLLLILPHSLGIEIRQAKNKHRIASVIMLITAVLNLIVSIPLAMVWGAVGSALGTWGCLILNMIFIDIYYLRVILIDIGKLYRNLIKMTVPLTPLVIIVILGMKVEQMIYSMILGAFFSLLYVVMIYRFSLDNYERRLISSIYNKMLNTIKNDRNS